MATKSVKLSELKVVDLKRELEERELETSGTKSQLQQRLREAVMGANEDPDSPMFETSCGSGDLGKLLKQNNEEIAKSLKEELKGNVEEISKNLDDKLKEKFEDNSKILERIKLEMQESYKVLKTDLQENSEKLDNKIQEVEIKLIKRIEYLESVRAQSGTLLQSEPDDTSDKSGVRAEIAAPVEQHVPVRGGHVGLPEYDGKMPWEQYAILFNTAAEVHKWSKTTKAAMLSLSLRGDALSVLQAIPLAGRQDYEELVRRLEMRFGQSHMEQVYRTQLRNRYQKPQETLQEFEADIARLVRNAYSTYTDEMCESYGVERFILGLRETETQQALMLARPKTLSEALIQALEYEAVRQSVRSQARVRAASAEKVEPQLSVEGIIQKVLEALKTKRRELRCWDCGELGHPRSKCKARRSPQQNHQPQEN